MNSSRQLALIKSPFFFFLFSIFKTILLIKITVEDKRCRYVTVKLKMKVLIITHQSVNFKPIHPTTPKKNGDCGRRHISYYYYCWHERSNINFCKMLNEDVNIKSINIRSSNFRNTKPTLTSCFGSFSFIIFILYIFQPWYVI